MLSKNKLKYIQSLHQKKYRQQQGAFLVEGAKSVQEVLRSGFEVELVVATELFYKENAHLTDHQRTPVEIASVADLERGRNPGKQQRGPRCGQNEREPPAIG